MTRKNNIRILLISGAGLVLGIVLLANVLLIDVKGIHYQSGTDLNDYNGISYVSDETIPASRGRIFDRDGYVLAEDAEAWDVVAYISPDRPGNKEGTYYVDDKEGTAQALSQALGADYDELLGLLSSDNFVTYLGPKARGISSEKKEEIEALGLNGIEFVAVSTRRYPYSPYASNLIGFASYTYVEDGGSDALMGKSGVEAALDDYLTGTAGSQSYYKDTSGSVIVGKQTEYTPAVNGNDVYLTLNHELQVDLQECLRKSYAVGADSVRAWGIVMEAQTGRIVAYDNYPTYDQNALDVSDYVDYNAMFAYEPGSVMKTFTYAAAINEGQFSPDDVYNGNRYLLGVDDNGKIKRCSYVGEPGYLATLYNFDYLEDGMEDFWTGYARSINSGAITLIEKYVDQERFKQYLYDFGFFRTVDVYGIANEAEGVENMNYPIEYATATYGQGNLYTALQVVQGYSAFCNGGKMVKPYIIDRIVDSTTEEVVYQGQTEYAGQPVSESTAELILAMMKEAVNVNRNNGAYLYHMDNLVIGGKTGTAEVAENGVYSNKTIHSIVLTMPADDPEILVYICYEDNNPQYTQNQEYVRTLQKQIADYYNLYARQARDTGEPSVSERSVYQDAMPSLVNHTLSYSQRKLSTYSAEVVALGQGDLVVGQYPDSGTTLITGQRVLLLMDGGGLTMPDMTGWSRKEVTAFWRLTGVEVTLNGTGYVAEQNIAPGEPVDAASQIEVTLRQ